MVKKQNRCVYGLKFWRNRPNRSRLVLRAKNYILYYCLSNDNQKSYQLCEFSNLGQKFWWKLFLTKLFDLLYFIAKHTIALFKCWFNLRLIQGCNVEFSCAFWGDSLWWVWLWAMWGTTTHFEAWIKRSRPSSSFYTDCNFFR